MPTQTDYDILYIDIAHRIAKMSKARRLKVGAVIVKDNCIISYGWNGTASGEDNNCEDELEDGTLVSKDSIIHAEINSLLKIISSGISVKDATMYLTHSPCLPCARFIFQSNVIKEVVYGEDYRNLEAVNWLKKKKILVRKKTNSSTKYTFD